MTHRVFIVWAHPLFYETLHALLNHSSIEVVGASSDYQGVRDEIQTLQPDAVIIEETDNESTSQSDTFRLLDDAHWALQVVRLNLQDNSLRLYQQEQMTIGQVDDLLKLFLSD